MCKMPVDLPTFRQNRANVRLQLKFVLWYPSQPIFRYKGVFIFYEINILSVAFQKEEFIFIRRNTFYAELEKTRGLVYSPVSCLFSLFQLGTEVSEGEHSDIPGDGWMD